MSDRGVHGIKGNHAVIYPLVSRESVSHLVPDIEGNLASVKSLNRLAIWISGHEVSLQFECNASLIPVNYGETFTT